MGLIDGRITSEIYMKPNDTARVCSAETGPHMGVRCCLDYMSRLYHYGCMKTTIDIPEKELADAMRLLGAKSKREAVVTALCEFNARHRMARLVRFSGTCDFDPNAALEDAETREAGDRR